MPIYDQVVVNVIVRCLACGRTFGAFPMFAAAVRCPHCQARLIDGRAA